MFIITKENLILTLTLLMKLVEVLSVEPIVVRTKYGFVEGTSDGVSRDGKRFFKFLGVQYAVIHERFRSSVEPASWIGIKPAKEYGATCSDIQIHGDENCLFLNVFTPTLYKGWPTDALLPVVVFIHGGSFQARSSDLFGPNYYMDEPIVLVTINYRLGPLGFLSTEDENCPGNFGLKDQVMALKWIRDNIAAFGGNPSRVTITGNSAGGVSVTSHIMSPMSKGLFQHAVAQSGAFLEPSAYTRKPLRYARRLAELLGCSDTSNTKTMISCLKDVPATVLANRNLSRNATLKFFEDPSAFRPTVEPLIGDGRDTFMSESPYDVLVSGKFPKIPLLIGLTKEEGTFIWAAYLLFGNGSTRFGETAPYDRKRLQNEWDEVAPLAFYVDEREPPSRHIETVTKIKKFYFGSEFSLDADKINTTFHQLSKLYSDRLFAASAVRFINLYSKHAPVYPYLYTYNKVPGVQIEMDLGDLHYEYSFESTHTAELNMLFSPLYNVTRNGEEHNSLSRNVINLFTSFAQNGIPTATYGSERKFSPVNPAVGLKKWYKLDTDTELLDNIFEKRIAFWESLKLSDDDFLNCYC